MGRGAGLFVRADRRRGGKPVGCDGEGCAGDGAGEDSFRRLGVGIDVIEGAGVSRVLVGLCAGEEGGTALGVPLAVDRRYVAFGSGEAFAIWWITSCKR